MLLYGVSLLTILLLYNIVPHKSSYLVLGKTKVEPTSEKRRVGIFAEFQVVSLNGLEALVAVDA